MRITSLCRAAAVIAALFVPAAALAQIQLVPVVSGLSSPLFVGHAGDNLNRLFIVEQAGIIKVLQPGETEPTTFLDIRTRILAGGERGLLGLAFHPHTPATAGSSSSTPAPVTARWSSPNTRPRRRARILRVRLKKSS